MTPTIEDVAKAIAACKVQSLDWKDHIVTARAALEVLRSMIDEMLKE